VNLGGQRFRSVVEVSNMSWIRSLSSRRRSILWLGALALTLVGLPGHSGRSSAAALAAPQPGGRQTEEKSKAKNAKDLKELQRVFGKKPVTILYSTHNTPAAWSVEGARIIDVIEVFGMQYLHVQKRDGKPMLIRADYITAIRDD
jgi:hypothetical protein